MPRKNTSRRIANFVSLVTLLSATFGAVNVMSEQVRTFSKIPETIGAIPLAISSGCLLVLGLWLAVTARREVSILLDPAALRLDRGNVEHLLGREDDIERLTRLCRGRPLVGLEGESGAGKTALVLSGVIPALENDTILVPVYLDCILGTDWELGPSRALVAALRDCIKKHDATASGQPRTSSLTDIEAAVDAITRRLNKTPLIIIDQFDDYQAQYSNRYMLQHKSWITPEQLEAANTFWAAISRLLRSRRVHLLVITRRENCDGLRVVRFVEDELYKLDRLEARFVGPILARLTHSARGAKVVKNESLGWTELARKLEGDLELGGSVLPEQLRIVLAGLGDLPRRELTVRNYRAAGGLAGLEVKFIEQRISRAARLSGLEENQIRQALRIMMNAAATKTIMQPTSALVCAIKSDKQEKAIVALTALERDEVIRRREGLEEPVWQLDHDYLARAINNADRNANRWHAMLADGARAEVVADRRWSMWWRALLSPLAQIVLLATRLRGRFQYGAYRGYALRSLAKFMPYVLAVMAIYVVQHEFTEAKNKLYIERLVEKLGRDGQLPLATESEILRAIASQSVQAQHYAIHAVLSSSEAAERVVTRAAELTRAVVGLDASGSVSTEVARDVILPRIANGCDSRILQCALEISRNINPIARSSDAFRCGVIQALQNAVDDDCVSMLCDEVTDQLDRMNDSELHYALSVASSMAQSNGRESLIEPCAKLCLDIASRLESEAASVAIGSLLERITSERDCNVFTRLVINLFNNACDVDKSVWDMVNSELLRRISQSEYVDDLDSLARALCCVENKVVHAAVGNDIAIEYYEIVFSRLEDAQSRDLSSVLCWILSAPRRLPVAAFRQALPTLVSRIRNDVDAADVEPILILVGAYVANLDADDARQLIEALAFRVRTKYSCSAFRTLCRILSSISSAMSDTDLAALVSEIGGVKDLKATEALAVLSGLSDISRRIEAPLLVKMLTLIIHRADPSALTSWEFRGTLIGSSPEVIRGVLEGLVASAGTIAGVDQRKITSFTAELLGLLLNIGRSDINEIVNDVIICVAQSPQSIELLFELLQHLYSGRLQERANIAIAQAINARIDGQIDVSMISRITGTPAARHITPENASVIVRVLHNELVNWNDGDNDLFWRTVKTSSTLFSEEQLAAFLTLAFTMIESRKVSDVALEVLGMLAASQPKSLPTDASSYCEFVIRAVDRQLEWYHRNGAVRCAISLAGCMANDQRQRLNEVLMRRLRTDHVRSLSDTLLILDALREAGFVLDTEEMVRILFSRVGSESGEALGSLLYQAIDYSIWFKPSDCLRITEMLIQRVRAASCGEEAAELANAMVDWFDRYPIYDTKSLRLLLHDPICVSRHSERSRSVQGEECILRCLEKVTGASFDGDVWAFLRFEMDGVTGDAALEEAR